MSELSFFEKDVDHEKVYKIMKKRFPSHLKKETLSPSEGQRGPILPKSMGREKGVKSIFNK